MTVDTERWVSVAEAAQECGASKRTLYEWCKLGQLQTRKKDGRISVQPSAVQAVQAAHRAAQMRHPGPEAPQRSSTVRAGATETPALALAREHAEMKRLERDGERYAREADDSRATREKEAAEREAEREQRRRVLALQIQREELGLEEDRLRLARQRASEEARRLDRIERAAAERSNQELERQIAADRHERDIRHQEWVEEWERRTARTVRNWLGAATVNRAIQAVRRALQDCSPSMEEDAAADRVIDAVHEELADEIAAHRAQEQARREVTQAQRRAALVADAMRMCCDRDSADVRTRARAAAERAAEELDPAAYGAWRGVYQAASEEADAARAEESRRAEAERRDRAWSNLYAELPALASRALPAGATPQELEQAAEMLRADYRARPAAMDPQAYREGVRELLRPVSDRVMQRLVIDEAMEPLRDLDVETRQRLRRAAEGAVARSRERHPYYLREAAERALQEAAKRALQEAVARRPDA